MMMFNDVHIFSKASRARDAQYDATCVFCASDLMRCADEGHDESTNARIWRGMAGMAGMARTKKCFWPDFFCS